MDTEIIVACISAVATVGGVIITNRIANREIQHQLETHQAVTDTKLDNLTAELNKQAARIDQHNHLNERLIAVEIKLESLESKDE